jgi:hypothetical protein
VLAINGAAKHVRNIYENNCTVVVQLPSFASNTHNTLQINPTQVKRPSNQVKQPSNQVKRRYLVSLSKDATDCLPSRHLFPRQLQLPNSFSDPDAANLASLYIDEDDLLSTLPIVLPLLHQEAEAYFTGSKNARFLESFPKNVQYTKLQLSRMKGVGACFSGS